MMFPDWKLAWNVDGLGNWVCEYKPSIHISVLIACKACDGMGFVEIRRRGTSNHVGQGLIYPPWPWNKKPTDPGQVIAMAKKLAKKYSVDGAR